MMTEGLVWVHWPGITGKRGVRGGSRGARMCINRGEESSTKTRKTSIYPRKKFIDSHMSGDG